MCKNIERGKKISGLSSIITLGNVPQSLSHMTSCFLRWNTQSFQNFPVIQWDMNRMIFLIALLRIKISLNECEAWSVLDRSPVRGGLFLSPLPWVCAGISRVFATKPLLPAAPLSLVSAATRSVTLLSLSRISRLCSGWRRCRLLQKTQKKQKKNPKLAKFEIREIAYLDLKPISMVLSKFAITSNALTQRLLMSLVKNTFLGLSRTSASPLTVSPPPLHRSTLLGRV